MSRGRKIEAQICAAFVIALLFIVLNSKSTSPFYNYRFIDSNIFQYIGFSLLHGKIPYVDLFDHKGILLYWINALGCIIHTEYGIVVLQVLHLTAVLIVWSKMLYLYRNVWVRNLVLVILLIGTYAYYDEGNLAEEWSLLFISLPIMLWMETLKNKTEFGKTQSIIIGLCLGTLCLLRINNAIPILIILLWCLAEALCERKYQYVKKATAWISLGFIILPLTACIYMFLIDGIKGIETMFYAMITFNMEYAKECGMGYQVIRNNILFYSIPFIPLLFLFLFIRSEWRKIVPLFLAHLFTIMTIGGSGYHHYLLIFIPLQVACLALLPRLKVRYLAVAIAFIVNIYLVWGSDFMHFSTQQKDIFYEAFCEVIKPIPESKRDKIWNLGGAYFAKDFMKAGLIQQNRILLPFQLTTSERLYQEEKGKLQKVKPEYVVFATFANEKHNWHLRYRMQDNYKDSDADYQFLTNNYRLIATAGREDGSTLYCYQLNKNK